MASLTIQALWLPGWSCGCLEKALSIKQTHSLQSISQGCWLFPLSQTQWASLRNGDYSLSCCLCWSVATAVQAWLSITVWIGLPTQAMTQPSLYFTQTFSCWSLGCDRVGWNIVLGAQTDTAHSPFVTELGDSRWLSQSAIDATGGLRLPEKRLEGDRWSTAATRHQPRI